MLFSNSGKFGWRTEKQRWKPTMPRPSLIANHDGSTSVQFSKYKLSGHLIKCRRAELDGDWTSFPHMCTPTHTHTHTHTPSPSLSVLSFLLHSNILTHSSNKEHLTLDFYSATDHRVQYNLINISRMHKHTHTHTHTHTHLHGGGRSTGPIYLRSVALRSPGPKS